MRVCVTGSRQLEFDEIRKVLSTFDLFRRSFGINFVGVGDAHGVDETIQLYCHTAHVEYRVFHADWDNHGKSAGPIRNRAMLETVKPDILIAYPGGAGTANCKQTARALGITIIEVTPA